MTLEYKSNTHIDQLVKHGDYIFKHHAKKQAGSSFKTLLQSLYKPCDNLNGYVPSLKKTFPFTHSFTLLALFLEQSSFIFKMTSDRS